MAGPIAEVLGQPVVDNRPGAGGILAAELAARSPADGHTLFLGGADTVVHAFLLAGCPPLNPLTDFTPIARATRDRWMVVATPALRADTLAGLAEAGRRRPGELTYASFGEGTLFHLLGACFAQRLGFEAVHVPYRGDYTPDLLAGRVSFLVQPTALLLPHVAAGRLRALAVLSPERLSALPGVPAIAEAGHPDLGFNMGVILFAPGCTLRSAAPPSRPRRGTGWPTCRWSCSGARRRRPWTTRGGSSASSTACARRCRLLPADRTVPGCGVAGRA